MWHLANILIDLFPSHYTKILFRDKISKGFATNSLESIPMVELGTKPILFTLYLTCTIYENNSCLILKDWLSKQYVLLFKITSMFFIKEKMGVNFQYYVKCYIRLYFDYLFIDCKYYRLYVWDLIFFEYYKAIMAASFVLIY